MTPLMVGADADELERLAVTLRGAADDLDGHAGAMTMALRSVEWVGGVATRFGSNWRGGHRSRIAIASQHIRDAAAELDRSAAEQRAASRIDTSTPTGPPASGPAVPAYVGRVTDVLTAMGAAQGHIDVVADLAQVLADRGEVAPMIDVLTDEHFVTFLRGADRVLDAGSVIIDAVTDFAEHPGLALDDRIVHALADTAARFGVEQGMEVAAEWLAGAATAALLPGFGAVLAPFVGQIAGAVAGELMDMAVDAVDGATDAVDRLADSVVAAYQGVKSSVDVVVDVAQAAAAVVGDTVDLAGDVAGLVVDAGDVIAGAGGDLVGALGFFD